LEIRLAYGKESQEPGASFVFCGYSVHRFFGKGNSFSSMLVWAGGCWTASFATAFCCVIGAALKYKNALLSFSSIYLLDLFFPTCFCAIGKHQCIAGVAKVRLTETLFADRRRCSVDVISWIKKADLPF
jgi:hypothetical protein